MISFPFLEPKIYSLYNLNKTITEEEKFFIFIDKIQKAKTDELDIIIKDEMKFPEGFKYLNF